MISHLHSASVAVSDQTKAVEFYTKVLGWEVKVDAPMGPDERFVTVAPPGAQTQLALSPAAWFGKESATGGFTGISFITFDIDETYKTLTERGVKFKNPPETMPWGDRATWFYDQDGNEFFLNQEANPS
jgi:catechol 2,3-dioxygenase-like lactoylglutathione lyase family enzyme